MREADQLMTTFMVRWATFAKEMPEMAAAGLELLYQFGPGLGYLATIRRDGGPRIHPVCPTVVGGGLYVSLGESPKRTDLRRRGLCALHTFPRPDVDDEFFLAGRAKPVDAATESAVHRDLAERGVRETGGEQVFELLLERALWAKYGPRPSWPPVYTRWHGIMEAPDGDH